MPKKRTAENEIVVPTASGAASLRRKSAPRPRAKRSVEPAETVLANVSERAAAAVEMPAAGASEPTRQEIAQLAYSFWEARGCQGGSPEEDWQRAEQQLRVRTATVVA